MSDAFDLKGYEQSIERRARDLLSGAKNFKDCWHSVSQLYGLAEDTLARHMDPVEQKHIACTAGCGTCCAVNVAVLLPEAAAIITHLKESMGEEEVAKIIARLESLYPRILWLDDDDRVLLRQSCAFLTDQGACAIYPVRPLICRSITSANAEDCREAIAFKALGEERTVLINLFQKTLMDATFRGLGAALAGLNLDSRSVKLTVAVWTLLQEPERMAAFLQGEPIPCG
ncbi:YkgJ family cysteine cluster protein [Desulfuromonas sp. AOP6]|uniref:YkgJ family cysteine cluster protein n=1 Tax=Desulfuromonas sp. AOP6 TaxID=1566351 RepID=UPI00127CC396|nr:YkgJ family cysteine cluster protein [Desulfuromonas sp. AOP6]BCA80721.1 zinc/iron-chelating domain-containing protein [Desulfuromonas sp. AOP6]